MDRKAVPKTKPAVTVNLDKPWFDIPEVMELLGLSRATIYSYIANGALKTRKVGKRRFVPKAALREFCSRDHAAPAA